MENLQEAIEGETYEFKEMYPDFLKRAEEAQEKPAVFSFKNALAVEEVHAGLYGKALESVKSGRDLEEKNIYVCPVCGNTVEGEAPHNCPVCGVAKERFVEVE